MELRNIDTGMHIAATQGLTLTLHEKASLDLALSALIKNGEDKRDLFFWGKLLGKQDSYYVAYVTQEDESMCPAKKFFYSTKEYKFRELPPLTADETKKFASIRGISLTGDPTWVTDTGEDDGGAGHDTEVTDGADSEKDAELSSTDQTLTEIQILSGLVRRIDDATAVIPRGAYTLKNGRKVTPSPEFKGLVYSNAQELSSWVHFRPAEHTQTLRRLAAEDYQFDPCVQFHADSFETLQDDVPKGSWVFRHDPASDAVTLRSLLWPGYVAYCELNTTNFGSVYIGDGQQNLDLPFLLP